ncbi:hypothetical protein VPH35_134523 [Triticum aestivum]
MHPVFHVSQLKPFTQDYSPVPRQRYPTTPCCEDDDHARGGANVAPAIKPRAQLSRSSHRPKAPYSSSTPPFFAMPPSDQVVSPNPMGSDSNKPSTEYQLKNESKAWAAALRVLMVLDLLGLMGAYADGSCRDTFTTIYSSVIMSAILLYIMIAFFVYVFSGNPEKQAEDPKNHKREDQHEVLMLLATFVVTITYVAGLNPPGGFWSNSKDGHLVSNPIMQEHNSSRYQAFFVCNTTAFVSSLLIIILLLDKKLILSLPSLNLNKSSARFVALYGFIVVALFGLVGAYAAGSCREPETTTYVVCLIGAVLAYISLQVVITKAITENNRDLFVEPESSRDNETTGKAEDNKALERAKTNEASKKSNEALGKAKAEEPEKSQANQALEKARNLVILLATLVASITYQAGLDPPGGLWPDDRDGHKGGDPVLLTTHPTRYKVFFYSNSAAFVASLIVITMVQSSSLLRRHTLEAAMLLDLFGLIGAYAAGSCRDVSSSIYVVALAGAVLVYVVIHIVFFTLDHGVKPEEETVLDNRREVLLLLAILVATLTYQAGLTPPGGFWSADDNLGHHAGFPVLLDNFPHRYRAFFYCNVMSFMASVALIVLLVNPNLYRPGIRCYALYVCMVAGMFGLMGAYAAGSSRHLRTSIYVLTLVAAVFAFVILLVIYFWKQSQKKKISKQDGNGSDVSHDQGPSGQGVSTIHPSQRRYPSADIESTRSREEDNRLKEKDEKEPQDVEDSPDEKRNKDLREYLMLVGVLAASVTYQSGLKPPGGLWQDNNNGHSAGNSILHDINRSRYQAFFYSNSTSFIASIVVVVLLLPKTLHGHKLLLWPMHTAILLNMLGLLGAYAAGSTREWETSRNVICLVIPVLVCVAGYATWSLYKRRTNATKEIPHEATSVEKS